MNARKMKVCLFADSFLPRIGGMEFVIHYLANSLCDIGCDVTVIAKRAPGNWTFNNKYDLVRYGKLFPGSGRTGFDFLTAVITIYKENKKYKFDIINCHNIGYAGRRVAFAKKLVQTPIVMTPHGDDLFKVPEINLGLRLNKKWDRIIKKNLSVCDAVTAISSSFIDELSFLEKGKIYRIPNGIDTKLFSNNKGDYLNEILSLDPKKKIVISVGRYHKQKDYESGVRAFNILKDIEEGKDIVYVIIGNNSNLLEPLVQSLNLKNKVFLLPPQNQDIIAKCYQSAWCFFSPSIMEGLSLVSIEAMSTGLPLVLTEIPGNIDVLNDNGCGIFVQKGDPTSMANGILSLASDKNLYEKLSNMAIMGSKNYDWSNIARMYLDVYKKVVEFRKN